VTIASEALSCDADNDDDIRSKQQLQINNKNNKVLFMQNIC